MCMVVVVVVVVNVVRTQSPPLSVILPCFVNELFAGLLTISVGVTGAAVWKPRN